MTRITNKIEEISQERAFELCLQPFFADVLKNGIGPLLSEHARIEAGKITIDEEAREEIARGLSRITVNNPEILQYLTGITKTVSAGFASSRAPGKAAA